MLSIEKDDEETDCSLDEMEKIESNVSQLA